MPIGKYKLKVPEAWDKNYKEKLDDDIQRYLNQFFYNGPFDEKIMMSSLMREGNGQLNPHFVHASIKKFLKNNKDSE